jgi:predicted DsbA family dithiol-disulfide isomerase
VYDLDVQFAPFLLDPTTPPEGKPRRQVTQPGEPPTAIEQRAISLGITFTRGRTWTSNSHLALEAAAFVDEQHDGDPVRFRFHRAMFKAYFEDLADIGDLEVVVGIAEGVGVPTAELRAALTEGRYRAAVDEGVQWAQQVGVTAVPTFVLDGRHGIVGAHEGQVFADVLQTKLGRTPRS